MLPLTTIINVRLEIIDVRLERADTPTQSMTLCTPYTLTGVLWLRTLATRRVQLGRDRVVLPGDASTYLLLALRRGIAASLEIKR